MKYFFGFNLILAGSAIFLCGGSFLFDRGTSGIAVVLGLIPGGILFFVGILLLTEDQKKKKLPPEESKSENDDPNSQP
ncbi:MAG: hypothetical protein EBQ92_04840 [Proteobacteria bacterium]|nr:hypothetical protein [Pseudomonadota bacterium]